VVFWKTQILDRSDGNGKPRQWNVILGSNRVGKTTLLRSLVVISTSGEIADHSGLRIENQFGKPLIEKLVPSAWSH
jgi:ABC-type branched-subunit amino acid transport system ATPase component